MNSGLLRNKKNLMIVVFLVFIVASSIGIIFSMKNKNVQTNSIKAENSMNICYATDENYIYPTLVSMTSLMENLGKDSFCKITILLSKGVSTKDEEKLKSLEKSYKNCSVNLVDMSGNFENSEQRCWSTAMYYRLNLPQILKDESKCIYIDGDTIVRKDLKEMYNLDLTDYYIAGVRDFNTRVNSESTHYKTLGIPNLNSYVCSGVLVMNLEKMRNDNLNDIFEKLVKENDEKNIYHFPDQDILNKVCYGKILCMPLKYGALIHTGFENSFENSDYAKWASNEKDWEEGRKDPVIVHFTGPKPWTKIYSDFCKEWWEYAEKTIYKEDIKKVYPI